MNRITLTRTEFAEIREVLTHKICFEIFFGGMNLTVSYAIFLLSKFQIEAAASVIYVLLRVFLVTAFFGVLVLARGILHAVALRQFEHGACELIKCTRAKRCSNYHFSELKNKSYVMLKCVGFRYALRVQDK